MKNKIKVRYVIASVAMFFNTTLVADEIAPIDCMIEPNVMVELSSSVEGVLGSLSVDKSDEVKKGQIIATLKSDIEQVGVKTSAQRLKLTQSEYSRAVELFEANAITQSEKEQSDSDNKLAELELSHAKTNLALRQIKSPIDGVVVKRYFTSGEYVDNKPIIKLAQLHPLKIEVVSSVENYGKIKKGMRAIIQPEFGQYENLIAEVVVVDKVIDAASGTFGVRLELDNKDHAIPGGLKCQVTFLSDSGAVYGKSKENKASQKTVAAVPVIEKEVLSTVSDSDGSLMCATIGPYKSQNRINKVLSNLNSDIKRQALRSKADTEKSYLVTSKIFKQYKDATAKMQEMKAAGESDMSLLGKKNQYHIALGIYNYESMASKRVNALKAKGFQVSIKPRAKNVTRYWADVAYLPSSSDALDKVVSKVHKTACDNSIELSLLKAE